MFYKVILDNAIIDVVKTPLPYCTYFAKINQVIFCSEGDNPQGIALSRTGQYYHVDGWFDFPPEVIDSGGTVQLVEITEQIYNDLETELNKEKDSAIEDSSIYEIITETDNDEPQQNQTMAQKLRSEIEDLKEQNNMLLECILELSEMVYK